MNVNDDKIALRELARLEWRSPASGLATLKLKQCLPMILFGKFQSWREQGKTKYLEELWSCIFVRGLSLAFPAVPFEYAHGELRNHRNTDLWVRASSKSEPGHRSPWIYRAVQIKEFVPEDLNPNASFQDLLNKLTYNDPELCVVIILNRKTHIRFPDLKPPRARIGQLWLVGKSVGGWFIFGSLLNEPKMFNFSDPVCDFL